MLDVPTNIADLFRPIFALAGSVCVWWGGGEGLGKVAPKAGKERVFLKPLKVTPFQTSAILVIPGLSPERRFGTKIFEGEKEWRRDGRAGVGGGSGSYQFSSVP